MWTVLAAAMVNAAAGGPLPELEGLQAALEGRPAVGAVGDGRLALAQSAAFWRARRFAEAATVLAASEPDPLLGPFVRFQLGEALFFDHRPAEAATVFEALAAGPSPVVAKAARRRWAEAELEAGRPAEAAKLFKACLQGLGGGPATAALREQLGRALLESGDRTAAAAVLREAWLQDPDDPAGRQARDELADLSENGTSEPTPSPAKVLQRARQLLRTGHPDAAHSDLAEIEGDAARPRQVEREELFMAQADRALGNDDEALVHWRHAAASSDRAIAAAARIALARADESRGNWEEAVTLLDKVAAARSGKGDGAEAEYLSAWYRLEHGQTEDALARFARLAAHVGRRHADEALWWRGWILYDHGRFEDAAAELERLASRPRAAMLAQALYWEARAFEALGREREAREVRARLQAAAPDSYYAMLANRGGPGPAAAVPAAGSCSAQTAAGPFTIDLHRAAELWALGYRRFVAPELDQAAREARGPQGLWAVAQVDAALGEPGRAFALLAGGRAACAEPRERQLALFPRPFRLDVERAAEAAGIDPLLIWSVMRQESRFRTEARSNVQAAGAMQLLAATSHRIASITGISPSNDDRLASGLEAAAWYLRALSDRFGGNLALVAAAYNAGPEPVVSWLRSAGDHPLDEFVERIPFRETRGYVKSVLANDAGYRILFGQPGPVVDARRSPGSRTAPGVAF